MFALIIIAVIIAVIAGMVSSKDTTAKGSVQPRNSIVITTSCTIGTKAYEATQKPHRHVNTTSALVEINPDWNISISFSDSKSANFDRAIFLAKNAPQFKEYEGTKSKIYQATYSAKPQEYLQFIKLYELIANWKSTAVMICGEIVDRKIVGNLNYCYGDKIRSGNPNFCYGASDFTLNPFGCHRIQISAGNHPWYSFYFKRNGKFILDKIAMKTRIDSYAMVYKYCPCFNYGEIMAELQSLPEELSERQMKQYLLGETERIS